MRKYLAVITLAVLVVGLAVSTVACGGGVAGSYKVEGNDQELKDVKLVLNDDGTFKVSGPDSESGKTMTISGAYTLDGDAVTMKAQNVDEVEKGTLKDGKLVFESVTWVKE